MKPPPWNHPLPPQMAPVFARDLKPSARLRAPRIGERKVRPTATVEASEFQRLEMEKYGLTVDGWNPANQLRLVVGLYHCLQRFTHPKVVQHFFHQQYYTPENSRLEHNSLEVWKMIMFLSFHGWFVGSMLIFQGVSIGFS